jgi:hypothetical protein
MSRGFLAVLLALPWASSHCFGGGAEQVVPAVPTTFRVHLTCRGDVPLSPGSSLTLSQKALQLVQSSHSNSLLPEWRFPVAEVQEEFRAALTSEHLRVVFGGIRTIPSAGGMLQVREIIVRLGPDSQHPPFPDRFIDALFTIDDKGRIVGHALYSGAKLVALWGAVVNAGGNADLCQLPKHFPGFY